jgi:hypothetical protein
VPVDLLSDRALNRATLARQLLLDRSPLPVVEAIQHLVGLQAQVPLDPYTALWSRLVDFDPEALGRRLVDREVVRIVVMRGTIHLVTAADALELRPLMQPVLTDELRRHRDVAPGLVGVDLIPVLAFARELLGREACSMGRLRAHLGEAFPGHDVVALGYACRNHLALVQVPPRGVWGRSAQVTYRTAESYLGAPLAEDPSLDDLALRYFGAFGPATTADLTAWCRLTGLREVVDRIRDRLRPFRDERGRELLDLPDAPRPDPDTRAPVRFLPQYDNVLLSHADRRRFAPDEARAVPHAPPAVLGTVLHDGLAAATWRLDHDRKAGTARLHVDPMTRLTTRAASSIEAEGRRLLAFQLPDVSEAEVRVHRP